MPVGGLLWRLTNIVALFASVVGLFGMLNPSRDSYTDPEKFLIGLIVVLFGWLTITDIRNYLMNRPHRLKSESAIRNYMYDWISTGHRVHVFSRDLSWAQDDAMKSMLERKSQRNELNITVPSHVPILDELIEAGAIVNYYPDLEYVPQSRFTIANWERSDARVAVGHRDGRVHVVEEFSAGEHPVFYIANDLVQMVLRFDECIKSCQKQQIP